MLDYEVIILDLNNIMYLYRLSTQEGDPHEEYKAQLLSAGLSEMEACHEVALFMNTICDLME